MSDMFDVRRIRNHILEGGYKDGVCDESFETERGRNIHRGRKKHYLDD